MLRQLHSYDQSRFWNRLQASSNDQQYSGDKEALAHLISSVRKVANRAKWISSQICRYMPQYTLHEERHFLNVLAIMEALVPDDVMQRLTPLECALPILAAYTHALELREQRPKMKQKGEAVLSLVLGHWDFRAQPGAGSANARGRQSSVSDFKFRISDLLKRVADEETGQQWLRVTDNGVGTTEEVIKNYFTQIGKSYYRSPEFNHERTAMNAVGEVVSPISQEHRQSWANALIEGSSMTATGLSRGSDSTGMASISTVKCSFGAICCLKGAS